MSATSEVTAGGQMCEEIGSEPMDQGQGRGMGHPLQRESSCETPRVGRRAGTEGRTDETEGRTEEAPQPSEKTRLRRSRAGA